MRWGRFATFTLAAALAVMASDARAMSAALPEDTRCTVVGGDKLPAEAGGADALCAAVRQAIRAQAPHARYTAQLNIISVQADRGSDCGWAPAARTDPVGHGPQPQSDFH